ncbi:hypothetical protein D3C72_2440160 [compost metagenome]
MVIGSFKTQMSDAKRLEMINAAEQLMEQNFDDLKAFNDQNIALSIGRSKSIFETKQMKEVYDIN